MKKTISCSMEMSVNLGEMPVISEKLRKFVTKDEMEGFEDLEFMLKNEKTSKKVPEEIKKQYAEISSEVAANIDNSISDLIKKLEDMRSNSKKEALQILQHLLEIEESEESNDSILIGIVMPVPKEN